MEPVSEWRRQTSGGIKYKLLDGFPTGNFADEDAGVTEEYLLQASDFEAFLTESFPPPVVIVGTLFYPRRRPLPGFPVLVTHRVNCVPWDKGKPADPFGADSGAAAGTYDQFLRVTVEYGPTQENDQERDPTDPLTFLEISANVSGEFLTTMPRGIAVWQEDNGKVTFDTPHTIVVPTTEWTIRWTQVPWDFFNDTLIARLRSKLGKVNQGAMTTLHDAPAETILFIGYSRQQQFTWREDNAGQPPMVVEMKFLEKNFEDSKGTQVTQNMFWRSGVGWQTLLFDGGSRAYATTNLDEIFTGVA